MVTRDRNDKTVDLNVTQTAILLFFVVLKEAPKGNARRRLLTGLKTTLTCMLQMAFAHFALQKRYW